MKIAHAQPKKSGEREHTFRKCFKVKWMICQTGLATNRSCILFLIMNWELLPCAFTSHFFLFFFLSSFPLFAFFSSMNRSLFILRPPPPFFLSWADKKLVLLIYSFTCIYEYMRVARITINGISLHTFDSQRLPHTYCAKKKENSHRKVRAHKHTWDQGDSFHA